ncbi:MAG: T9SS type A sorting domain-containing protein [Saprospiraceae bacterium]
MKAAYLRLNACIWLLLTSFCWCDKLIANDLSFFLECPPSVTINCYDDVSNLDKWGIAYVWSNNKRTPAPAPVKIIYNTNACGIGTITRYWEVEDPYWVIQKCNQVITIIGGTTFGYADINWPPAYTIDGCNPSTDPRILPTPYNYPTFNKLKCSQPMYSYKDSKFTVSDGCMKVLREWHVIDWCQYKPNAYPAVGSWYYTQVIKLIVSDSTAKLICPLDTILDSKVNCKGTYVKLDSAKAISKCGFKLNIRNTSPYSKSKGPDASGDYPLGSTEFYYIAEFGCGKEIKCKVKVTVRNKIGPIPYCLNGLITALMPIDTNRDGKPDDGMIEIWAKDFNLGSYHPCGYKNLKYSFSADTNFKSKVFTCADLGKNEVQMWVTDSLGNQSFCKTYLEVQNNNANIPDCKRKDSIQTTIVVAGLVSDGQNVSLPDVKVQLKMKSTFQIVPRIDFSIKTRYDTIVTTRGLKFYVKHNDTTFITKYDTIQNQWQKENVSLKDGSFGFKDLIKAQDYFLSFSKRELSSKGININDAIVLLKHISGTTTLTDPLKIIAADINVDGVVNDTDFDLLYEIILGTIPYDYLTSQWRFIPKGFVFKNPLNPFADNFESITEIRSIISSKLHMDYTAIKVGELDGIVSGIDDNILHHRNSILLSERNDKFELVNVYPNPVMDDPVNFQLNIKQATQIQVEWFDAQGNILRTNTRSFDKGFQVWEQSVNGFPSTGIFFYRISDGFHFKYGKITRSE